MHVTVRVSARHGNITRLGLPRGGEEGSSHENGDAAGGTDEKTPTCKRASLTTAVSWERSKGLGGKTKISECGWVRLAAAGAGVSLPTATRRSSWCARVLAVPMHSTQLEAGPTRHRAQSATCLIHPVLQRSRLLQLTWSNELAPPSSKTRASGNRLVRIQAWRRRASPDAGRFAQDARHLLHIGPSSPLR